MYKLENFLKSTEKGFLFVHSLDTGIKTLNVWDQGYPINCCRSTISHIVRRHSGTFATFTGLAPLTENALVTGDASTYASDISLKAIKILKAGYWVTGSSFLHLMKIVSYVHGSKLFNAK